MTANLQATPPPPALPDSEPSKSVAAGGAGRAEVVVCPPATLRMAAARICERTKVGLGGQDCHAEASGAFTGDISAEMLKDAGATYVILGHSERRAGCFSWLATGRLATRQMAFARYCLHLGGDP